MMIILCQWDLNEQIEKFAWLLLGTSENCSRKLKGWVHFVPKAGRTRTDKISVGAVPDIGGTGISCNFMARQYTGPTLQSYRDDHRHVRGMLAISSINSPAFRPSSYLKRVVRQLASLKARN
jgi:hypothetical protein